MDVEVVVVIPVYKEDLTEHEHVSLKRGISILCNHSFVIISPENFDVSFLKQYFINDIDYQVKYFEQAYFKDIYGYNKLMMSMAFFEQFLSASHMLIYHLDAYVFHDDLSRWIKSGYDNIGGPWLNLKTGKLEPNSGNGGFCLRNVGSALVTLQCNTILFLPAIVWNIVKELPFRYWWKYKFVLLRLLFPIFQRSKRFIERYPFYEDKFWAKIAPMINKDFKVCPASEAIKFAFDAHPEKMYKLNNRTLPMGAHGWFRPERIDFWKDHIEELKQVSP